jgi:hypothetical protein
MFHPRPARWLATSAAVAALTAVSQTAPEPPAPAATGVQAPLVFRSALDGYRPFKDEQAIPWKEANDTVRARGGWRAYADEAAGPSGAEGGAHGKEADPHAGHAMPMPPKKEPRP